MSIAGEKDTTHIFAHLPYGTFFQRLEGKTAARDHVYKFNTHTPYVNLSLQSLKIASSKDRAQFFLGKGKNQFGRSALLRLRLFYE